MKENDLVHGEFEKWLKNVGMHKQHAYRFIKIADEFSNSNSTPVLHLGIKALYQLATMPEEQRNHVIKNGIETEIKSYQNIAGQSIFEIGRRLKHVKENDLAHGEFGKWLENVGLDKYQASRFIKVADEEPKLRSGATLGLKALYQISTIPEEQREEKHKTSTGEMKTPYEMTNKEREEFKRQLKQRDEEKSQLQSQLEQAQRSESIAHKQLEKYISIHNNYRR